MTLAHQSDRDDLLRDYAIGRVTWRELQERGFDDYIQVLSGLGELGLRPPIAPMAGSDVEADSEGARSWRAFCASRSNRERAVQPHRHRHHATAHACPGRCARCPVSPPPSGDHGASGADRIVEWINGRLDSVRLVPTDIGRRRAILDDRVALISTGDFLRELEGAGLIQSADHILDLTAASGRDVERQRMSNDGEAARTGLPRQLRDRVRNQ
jgi:hypothetical protein